MTDTSDSQLDREPLPKQAHREIQGNILRPYAKPKTRYIFLTFESTDAGRNWLANIKDDITTSSDWNWSTKGVAPDIAVNVSFTFAGLRMLAVSRQVLEQLPIEFREHPHSRAAVLGDDPHEWDDAFRDHATAAGIHAMVSIHYKAELGGELLERITCAPGVQVVHEDKGERLGKRKEHFGYADGVGQPHLLRGGAPLLPGHDEIPLGEFILGYEALRGGTGGNALPMELVKNGTFIAYRKMEQDVAAFRKLLSDSAKALGLKDEDGTEWVASRLAGRWRDGTPVDKLNDATTSDPNTSEQSDADIANDRQRNNNFDFATDPNGERCPLGSHIRRMNPRKSASTNSEAIQQHRIIRRGITYGPPMDAGAKKDDGKKRGILFVAVNASLARQFEFLQRVWANTGGFLGLDPQAKDPLIGNRPATPDKHSKDDNNETTPPESDRLTVYSDGLPQVTAAIPRLITVRSSLYLFVPSRSVIESLASVVPVQSAVLKPFDDGPSNLLILTGARELTALQQLKDALAKAAKEKDDNAIAELKRTLRAWFVGNLRFNSKAFFAELAEHQPNFRFGNNVVVTRYEDVVEVLSRHQDFSVRFYAAKMQDITGPFFLGEDDTPLYRRDTAAGRMAFPLDDLDQVRAIVRRAAVEQLAEVSPSDHFNVISDLAEVVPVRLIEQYCGVSDPDGQLKRWCRSAFHHIFLNQANDAAVAELAIAAGNELANHIDSLIVERKQSAYEFSVSAPAADALGRFIEFQSASGIDDTTIRHILIGLVVGTIDNVVRTVALVLDELLSPVRATHLANARMAAQTDDLETVRGIVLEALRFRPQSSMLIRYCEQDSTIARGTDRETTIPQGSTVYAATSHAMMDPSAVDTPHGFKPGRPDHQYLHFGHGLHSCFGREIAEVMIPEIVLQLLRKGLLKRQSELTYNEQADGQKLFPESLLVSFDGA